MGWKDDDVEADQRKRWNKVRRQLPRFNDNNISSMQCCATRYNTLR